MKKRLLCAVVMATMVWCTATALAADVNPLSDVPAGHWAYKSLNKLVKAGIIDGYKGKFNGGKTLTRFEMAKVIAKAMGKAENAGSDVRTELDKLAKAFPEELDNILIRLDEMERLNSDKVRMKDSEIRLRYESIKQSRDGVHTQSIRDKYYIRTTLAFHGEINKDWDYVLKLRGENEFDTSGVDASSDSLLNQGYIKGPLGPTTVSIGKWYFGPMDTLFSDNYAKGLKVYFRNNQLRGNVYYANHVSKGRKVNYADSSGNYILSGGTLSYVKTRFVGTELTYKVRPDTTLEGYYFKMDAPGLVADTTSAKYWGISLAHELNNDFKLTGYYMKSDAQSDNTTHLLKLSYKEAKKTRPGSYCYYIEHGKKEIFATYETASIRDENKDYHSQRVTRFGIDYVPFRNTLWENYVDIGKATDNSGVKEVFIASSLYFYF